MSCLWFQVENTSILLKKKLPVYLYKCGAKLNLKCLQDDGKWPIAVLSKYTEGPVPCLPSDLDGLIDKAI